MGGGVPPGGGAERSYCPFEDPSLGFFDGLVETLKQVFASPITFFRRLPDTGDIGKAILFLLILTFIGSFFTAAWGMILTPLQGNPEEIRQVLEQLELPPAFIEGLVEAMSGQGAMINAISQVLLGPILSLIGAFILAGIYHVLLMLFGGANRQFGATFRVVAYAHALQLLIVIPWCGGLICGLWQLVLYCIGLATAHRTDGWRAVLAVLVPFALCCLCCAAFFFLMVTMIAGASH